MGQRSRAGERLLAVGSHDRRPANSAGNRITQTPPVLVEQANSTPRIAARSPWPRLDQHLDASGCRDSEKSKTQKPAKLAHARITRAAAAARDAHGKPDLIASRAAIDTLQHKLEVEAELQFSNDYERWFLAANSNEIAAADLAFDGEAKTLEEALHRDVQRRFPFRWPLPICRLT